MDTTMWLTFADDDGCLGVIIVDTGDFVEACSRVAAANLYPGGEVAGNGFNPADMSPIDRELFARLPRMKLLKREEVEAFGVETVTFKEMEAKNGDDG